MQESPLTSHKRSVNQFTSVVNKCKKSFNKIISGEDHRVQNSVLVFVLGGSSIYSKNGVISRNTKS